MRNPRPPATVHLPVIVPSLLAARFGLLHAAWVLFPLLDARLRP